MTPIATMTAAAEADGLTITDNPWTPLPPEPPAPVAADSDDDSAADWADAWPPQTLRLPESGRVRVTWLDEEEVIRAQYVSVGTAKRMLAAPSLRVVRLLYPDGTSDVIRYRHE